MLYALARLEPYIPIQNYILKKLVLFLIMAICITAIEYIAGLIFIKGMNIKLWDYSDQWGNVQGIICPLFSFFWLLLSATYYFFIHPYILNSLNWLAQNLAFSFIIGFFFGIFVLDLAYSLRLVRRIRLFLQVDHENKMSVWYVYDFLQVNCILSYRSLFQSILI